MRFDDFVGAEAIEEIIPGVEGANMFEAQELPAAGVAGDAVRQRRAELAGLRTAVMVAPRRIGALDAAMKATGATGCFGRIGGDGGVVLGEAMRL